MLVVASTSLKAQFIDVDWNIIGQDTLMPRYTTVVALDDDFAFYDYSAQIEYPEFSPMTAREVEQYRLNLSGDTLPAWPRVETSVQISAKKGLLDVCFIPIVYADGKFQRINSFKLVINKRHNVARSHPDRVTRAETPNRYSYNSVLDSGRWVKIRVKESGVYKITRSELSKMGFKNPDKVRLFGYGGRILPETNIHELSDDLREVPLWREKDYLLFYANGTIRWDYVSNRYVHKQNHYSQYSYYFLNEGDDEPISFPKKELSADGASLVTTYPDYALYENDKMSLCTYGRVLLDDYDFASGRTVSYKFDLPGATDGLAYINLSFGSNATSTSKVDININDKYTGFLNISKAGSSEKGRIASATFNISGGAKEQTVVRLSHSASDNSLSGFLDYIELNFTRTLALRGSYSNFRGNGSSGTSLYKIASTNADTHVWQVTTPSEITELALTYDGNGCLTVAADASHNDEFVVVDVKGSFPSVETVGEVPNQNLHALGQTDMVIIVPSNKQFLEPAERLAEAHRLRDGLTVVVVTAEQIYNEFSSGTPDATAYRRFMKMFYDRASSAADAPKYLLLFGDGVADNRLITYPKYSQDNLLLCYESENSVDAVRSYVLEDYYAYLDDNEGRDYLREKIDIGVGRIPVQTLNDANNVVNKIIAYMENKNAGPWQNIISLLGDDGDKFIPNQHMKDAENIASYVEANHRSYMVDRIYWDEYPMEVLSTGNTYPMVTKDIYDRMEEGALIVNYSGHGSANLLSHEMSWKTSDMAAVSSPNVPFWVTASCDITPFDIGDASLGETAMLNPNGAAIGLFTTTRTVLQSYNAIINREFMKHLLALDENDNITALGDAVRKAKCGVIANNSDLSENKLQYLLIGDPALRLNMPRYNIVVDKFNEKTTSETGEVSAGGILMVEGYIAKPDGSIDSDFNGLLYPTLFDCAEVVTTRDNTGLGAYNYTAFRKTLFVGSDSVRGGRFKVEIPVPLDISYADEQGMLNLFAIDTLQRISAQGHYENFVIGGTSSINNDGKGPEIKMYLNKPEFMDGDEVNAAPCLFVELFDENGINIVGSGVGHDIMAIIDNNKKYTYSLNNYFEAQVGDYRRGTIVFPLSTLDAGEHTLLLRAWDLYNNSAADTLSFVVVPNLAPDFVDITVSSNPVHYGEKVQFTLVHDRPQGNIDITLELYNFQGQKLWSVAESGVSDGNIYTYVWDVTAQGGQPIPTGVYLYRACIASGGGVSKTKTRKIIILNNK